MIIYCLKTANSYAFGATNSLGMAREIGSCGWIQGAANEMTPPPLACIGFGGKLFEMIHPPFWQMPRVLLVVAMVGASLYPGSASAFGFPHEITSDCAAAYLNPDSGRFWTRDSFEGSQSEPLSLHKYLYVHANPVDGIDPSGHMLDFLLGSFLSISTRAEWESARAPIYQRAITMALEVGFAAAADATLESYILSRIVDVREYLRQAKEIWRMRNPGQQLPKIVPIPAAIIPDVAMHVATHQRAVPADAVLTRAPVLLNIAHRAVTLATYGAAGTNLKGEKLSWDEYPLAASMEGGRPSSGPLPMPGFCSVWKVPLRQNILQGVIVGASYTLEKIAPGGKFEVVVIP